MIHRKEWTGYVEVSKNENGTYTVKFKNGVIKNYDSTGVIKAITEDVKKLKESEEIEKLQDRDILENVVEVEIIPNNNTNNTNDTDNPDEELEFIKKNKDKLELLLENFKLVSFGSSLVSDGIVNEVNDSDKIKVKIPNELKELKMNDIITIKGNKEYYKKFKRYCAIQGITVSECVNYLFYYAMENLVLQE
jgi:hypothetical protein